MLLRPLDSILSRLGDKTFMGVWRHRVELWEAADRSIKREVLSKMPLTRCFRGLPPASNLSSQYHAQGQKALRS